MIQLTVRRNGGTSVVHAVHVSYKTHPSATFQILRVEVEIAHGTDSRAALAVALRAALLALEAG